MPAVSPIMLAADNAAAVADGLAPAVHVQTLDGRLVAQLASTLADRLHGTCGLSLIDFDGFPLRVLPVLRLPMMLGGGRGGGGNRGHL